MLKLYHKENSGASEDGGVVLKKEFDITGMTCASCAARIEKVVGRLPEVDGVSVNLATERMQVEAQDGAFDKVLAAVENAGFGAAERTDAKPNEDKNHKKIQQIRRRFILAACFAVPLFYLAMGPMVGLPVPGILSPDERPLVYACVQLGLTIPIIFVGYRFYTVGYSALLRGSPNMDSLIAVGTTASFGYSIYSLIRIARGDLHGVHGLYFESVGVIITLILLGKMLEAISKGKTSQAIRSLMKLVPETARILREGEELEIPSEQLKEGDILILRPGSRIPADGIVKAGQSTVDESMLTGESLPIDKKADDSVFAGSINLNGAMQVVVSRVGEQTTLGEMIRLVEEAQGTKAPIARLADVVSGYFVPIVMLIALLAAAAWKLAGESWGFALSILVSVLVIACPCALGLATPTAIMVGIGKGAEYGILFKNGEAMELLHRMNTVVLDKTGTLTTGKPSLTDLIPADGFTRQDLLLWVASAEQSSEHPLARAIVDQAVHEQISLLTPEEFEALPGRGVLAKLGGMELLAGNERLMRERNISFGTLEQALNRLTGEGKTPVYIAAGGVAAGIAAIADTLKPDSFSAVQKLKNQGIEVVMLTGDDRRTAEAIAKEAGISEIQAEVLPGDKADVVKRLQEEGKRVAMVGDGINDAPALVTADVGIAIGSGTDVAMESADVVLMHSVLSSVPTAMELSRRTIRNIRQNLFWAFAYNTLGIPIAAGVLHLFGGPLLNPMLAAAAMSLSSVSVLLNALRLKRFKE